MVSESRRRQLHSEGAAAVVHCHACCESSSSLLDTFWLPLANDLCHCMFWLQGTENNSPWLNWKSSLVNNFSYLEKIPGDSRACHLRNRTQKMLVVPASVEESTNQKLLIYEAYVTPTITVSLSSSYCWREYYHSLSLLWKSPTYCTIVVHTVR